MNRLVDGELRKILSTRLWWALLLGAMASVALATIAATASRSSAGAHHQQTVLAAATYGDIFVLIAGTIGITSEYRHLTSRHTFLFEPRRAKIVGAKLIAHFLLGCGYALACIATVLAIAVPWLAARNTPLDWSHNQLLWVVGGDIVNITTFAVVGIGVGALIPNQPGAITGSLAYLFVIGPLTQLVPGIRAIYPWLPGSAADATVDSGHFNHNLLHPAMGVAIFVVWAAVLIAAGAWRTCRRDVP